MGACLSSSPVAASDEVVDQKKRSQMIDKKLEEDSKRLRRECKILLLGMLLISILVTESAAKQSILTRHPNFV